MSKQIPAGAVPLDQRLQQSLSDRQIDSKELLIQKLKALEEKQKVGNQLELAGKI